ncbi:MAG: ABC transporter substrate-binding protein [Leptolyngbya sp. SIO1E4]|nr:ABC transporter substrate-binding protein [Leptolyngbya sp. SIO1E4]
MTCDRRRFLHLMAASTGLAVAAGCGQRSPSISGPLPSLGIGGSPILLTLPLAYLIEESSLPELVADIQFNPVRNHEQIKALLTSEQGQIAANPTMLSAGLYQQALPIQLLNVMIWGNIFVLSPDDSVTRWEDLRGKSVLIPFKGGMPEMIFRFLATQAGLQPDQDVTIQSTQDFQSTAQLLLAGQGDAGVFAEPQASSVFIRAQQENIELFYNLDFKAAWGQVTGQAARFPQAGVVALKGLVDSQPEVIDVIQTELRNSLDWIQQNPTAAAELGSKYMDIPPPVIERSLQNNLFEHVPAAEARPELEIFYESLMQVNPKLMKGQLPSAEFYGAV